MDTPNLSILIEKRDEYISKWVSLTVPVFLKFFQDLYLFTKKNNTKQHHLLKEFQSNIKLISQWDNEKKLEIYNHIISQAKTSKYEQLIDKMFQCYIRILLLLCDDDMAYDIIHDNNTITPEYCDLIYDCFLNVSRLLWKNTHLFWEKHHDYNLYLNTKEIESLIIKGIDITIKDSMPYDSLLSSKKNKQLSKQNISDVHEESHEESHEDTHEQSHENSHEDEQLHEHYHEQSHEDNQEDEDINQEDMQEDTQEDIHEDIQEDTQEEIQEDIQEENETEIHNMDNIVKSIQSYDNRQKCDAKKQKYLKKISNILGYQITDDYYEDNKMYIKSELKKLKLKRG